MDQCNQLCLSLIQGYLQGCEKEKNFCANILNKFSVDLDGIWYAVQSYWSDEPHVIFKEKSSRWCHEKNSCVGSQSYERLHTDYFQTWHDDR